MVNSILPLANWGVGTAMIIVFIFVCIGLTALVIYFVSTGKKKDEEN